MGFKIQKAKSVEGGDYDAELFDVEPTQGQFGACIKFHFRITTGEHIDSEVSMIRPAKLIPGNKLDKTLQSMGIDTSTIDDELDVDTLKNKSYRVTVENKTSAQGKVFANVVDVKVGTATKRTSVATNATVTKPKATPLAAVAPSDDDVPF